jgi:hypothetical protein
MEYNTNKNSNEAKYLIFISSTFRDLVEERSRVIKEVLRAEQFPVAMENFVASDKAQWETIERFLSQAGCMISIIGESYGTIEKSSGKSYTELEYEHAVKNGIPILSFLKTLEKSGKKVYDAKLLALREKVETSNRLVCFYKDTTDLVGAVASSISKEKNSFINPWYCSKRENDIVRKKNEVNLSLLDLEVKNYWNDAAVAMYGKYKIELDELVDKWEYPMIWEGGRDFKSLFEIRDDNNMISNEMRARGILKTIRYVWTDEENQMWVMCWHLKELKGE